MYDCVDCTLCHWSFQIPFSPANWSVAFSNSNNVPSRRCGCLRQQRPRRRAQLSGSKGLFWCACLPETAVEIGLWHERSSCMQICARAPLHAHVWTPPYGPLYTLMTECNPWPGDCNEVSCTRLYMLMSDAAPCLSAPALGSGLNVRSWQLSPLLSHTFTLLKKIFCSRMNKLFATYLGRTWTELAERKCIKKTTSRPDRYACPSGQQSLGRVEKKNPSTCSWNTLVDVQSQQRQTKLFREWGL